MAGEKLQKWALILGASSGIGAACASALARQGFNIVGVHLDRRSTMPRVESVLSQIQSYGCQALFFNVNAADPERRREVIQSCRAVIGIKPEENGIHCMLHSLAFGTLKPFICTDGQHAVRPADLNMTLDVMAHSLVYWVQDLLASGLISRGAKIFAMTSAGAHRIWPSYGPVSAAKAALESHVRQLAVELAPLSISVNALQAGITDTPAARKIPGGEKILARALENNPGKRLTTPEDVAQVLVALTLCESNWVTGNVIRIDGGEDLV